MEILDKVFTEEQVASVSDKILKKSLEGIANDLQNNFYNEMGLFLYEHYNNAKDKIEGDLISEITDQFIRDPMKNRYAELRRKLFLENKDMLVRTLTDEAIQKSVEDVIEQYTHRDYHFAWRWKDAIVRIILENWTDLQGDERINTGLLRKIDQLQSQIFELQTRLRLVSSDDAV